MKKFLCYDTNDAASGKIGVDNRGILKPNSTVPSGSAPYQQLVTDGTGTVKWEDRLAYEYVAETAVLEEQSVSFTPQGGHMKATITGFFEFVAGSTVIVSWDGVLYPCTAQEINSTTVVFGNFYLGGLTQDDTGEPFCIFAGQTNMALYPSDTSPNHDVSIFSDRKKAKIIDPKYTGLLAFSILWDGTSNYSATASYQEVRDAYDAKIPIFANLFVNNTCYPATEIMAFDDYLSFGCGTYGVSYSSDGTIGQTGPK